VLKKLNVKSHKGPYTVYFYNDLKTVFKKTIGIEDFIIVDSKVFSIYKYLFTRIKKNKIFIVKANEDSKTINNLIPLIENLVDAGFRKQFNVVAIGGGVIQDITCFLSTIIMRGFEWKYIPTTLLAQADSCIGSKSSINISNGKNILGTFSPPKEISLCLEFLNSLDKKEIMSGVGEIIKVHAIDGISSLNYLSTNFESIMINFSTLEEFIIRSLKIKKKYVEIDEFDINERNIFNFGHSFGHAIETITNYKIPHGIAITIGMKIAVNVSKGLGFVGKDYADLIISVLNKNIKIPKNISFDPNLIVQAMSKDKKNTKNHYRIILPKGKKGSIVVHKIKPDNEFLKLVENAL